MTTFYGVCVAIAVVAYVWLFVSDVRRSLNQHIMILTIILTNLGYLSVGIATTLQEAILASKIAYLGGCFVPLLYFFTICEVCKVDLRTRVRLPLVLFQAGVFVSVCTIGFSDLYYSHVEFTRINGYGHLIRAYGPLHAIYPLSLFCYLAAAFFVIIITFVKKKSVNHKELIYMGIAAVLTVFIYVMQKILHLPFDIYPVACLVIIFGSTVPIYHSNLYTVEKNRYIVSEQIDKLGFLTFDKNMKFMGCNSVAFEMFPELEKCIVGSRILNPGKHLNRIIARVAEYDLTLLRTKTKGHAHAPMEEMHIDDKIYDVEIHTVIDYLYRCVGYTLEFRDATEHYLAIELKERYNEELTRDVNAKTARIRTIQENTILGMAQMVESRDLSTGGHIRRTSAVVRIFAQKLLEAGYGFDKAFLDMVIHAAPMHDLGKIGVDDAILRKQGRFTPEEYEQMKKHAEIGGNMVHDILSGVEEPKFVLVATNVARYHHEKMNGQGYPYGIVGNQIPIEARIMALADVFDALVSPRCYKKAFSYDKAFGIIKEDMGSHFDERLGEIFLTCRPELEAYYDKELADRGDLEADETAD